MNTPNNAVNSEPVKQRGLWHSLRSILPQSTPFHSPGYGWRYV